MAQSAKLTRSRSTFPPALLLPIAFCLLVSAIDLRAQDAALERARRFFEAGSYDRAAQLIDAELAAHPANADAHLLLGQIDALEGKRAEAIQQFTSVLELEPKSAIAYNTLGTALNRFAEFDQARKAFEQAVALDSNLVSAHINLAMAMAQSGDSASATQQLQASIGLAPQAQTAATAHYLLAKIYAYEDGQAHTAQAQTQTTSRAMEELNQALRIRPRYQEAWLALGRLRSEANDEPGALTALERAVACDPKDYDSQYELGSEALAQERASQAVFHLEAARKLTEHPSLALLYKLDRALRKQGDAARAKQVRAEAQALIAQDTQANQHFREAQTLDRDGVELEAKGETAKALENYRAALELNPQQDGFRLNYALALCRLNRWQQGIAELNDILQRDPSNADARRALYIAQDKAKANQAAQPTRSAPAPPHP